MPTLTDARFDALRDMGYLGAISDMTMDWLIQNIPAEHLQQFAGIRWEYRFDGSTMYATIPDWTPNGLPFEVSVEAVPLTLDGTARRIESGTVFGIYLAAGTNAVTAAFLDTALAVQTVTGPVAVVGQSLSVRLSATASGTTLTVNGTDYPSASVAASAAQNPISAIAALPTPTEFFHGPIWS